jgi:formate hydrogenlyase transcriptional activator
MADIHSGDPDSASKPLEERLRLMIDQIPTLVWSKLPDGSLDFFNQRFREYSGLSLEEGLGWGWINVFHPDDRAIDEWRAALAAGKPFHREARIRGVDGNYRWFELRAAPVRNGQGVITNWLGTSTDIDDRKWAEAELRQLVDAVPQHIIVLDGEGRRLHTNQPVLDYHGYSLEEFLAVDYAHCFHPGDLESFERRLKEGIASGEAWETEVRVHRNDGQYRWFLTRANPFRDDQGRIIRWYVSRTDIEDRKRAEDEVHQIVDAVPHFMTVLSGDGRRLYVNEVALKFFGWTLDDFLDDKMVKKVFHPEDVTGYLEDRQRGISLGVPFKIEARIRRCDGHYRWFLFLYNPRFDAGGQIDRWYATGTDIEDQKQAQDALKVAFAEIKQLRDELYKENLALKEEIDQASFFEEIVGSSEPLRRVVTQVKKVATADSTVLITGETGTGKELIARAIHKRSPRSSKAFVSVNCAAIPAALIGSELFGHERGAFTGATQRRLGRFELAEGGTLFLDEVGDLPAETQVALLRVLQERQFERIGGNQTLSTNVRIVAATNRDLRAAIKGGTFRQDLFYRLNVFPIDVPPLRDRKEDIPLLVEYLTERYASKTGKKIKAIEKRTLELLNAYQWPGNIRELQNVIERAVILCEGDTLSIDEVWLPHEPARHTEHRSGLARLGSDREKALIESALRESKGQVSGPSGAAAKLGIPRSTLETKIRALGIDKHLFKSRFAS